MPLNSENQLEHGIAAKTDPAHAWTENADHLTSTGEKPVSMADFITDTAFIPTLDKAPLAQKLKSHLFLTTIIFGIVATLWFFDFALFQSGLHDSSTANPSPVAPPAPATLTEAATEVGLTATGVSLLVMALLFLTGTADVDFWSLVMEYGWYTIPIVAGVGVFFVIAKESTEPLGDLV